MPHPDTSKERLNEIVRIRDGKKRYYNFKAIDDLIAMVDEKDKLLAEKEVQIRDLEDELKLYTERGPWNNGTIRV